MYQHNTPFTEGLFKMLIKSNRVEVYCCVQVRFDKYLKERNWKIGRDYKRKAIVLSQKGSRRDIDGYIYEVLQ